MDEFKQKPLRVHSFLAGIPMHSLDCIELPGGDAGMTLQQISEAVGFGGEVDLKIGLFAQSLFALRGLIGYVLRWDNVPDLIASATYAPQLSEEDRQRSVVTPGKPAGISRILYQFENEMLAEIINRTVHCFYVMASEPTATGYRLWVGVYVKKLNWFTPIYMALVSPLLKWVIYPAMHRGMKKHWEETFRRQPQNRPTTGRLTGGMYDHTVK